MKAMTTLVSIAPLLAASCCVNKHVESCGQAPLDPHEEATAAQTEQPPVDPSNPSQRPCSPTPPTASTQCSNSEHNTICVPFTGDVYIWSRSAGCRERIHRFGSEPYECFDTGALSFPYDEWGGATEKCFERVRPDGTREVMINTGLSVWPFAEKAGWRLCSEGFSRLFRHVPDCP